jgi:hypothetical protein
MGAKHDPKAELCDNKVDDTGDGKVDCDDDTCKNNLICRQEIPGKVDVFVMSQCPFGVKALDAMKEVMGAFGTDIKFDVHFIGDEAGGQLTSMHGQAEVDEDIREICAKAKFPEKYMEYIWCRNPKIRDVDWKACAINGIDPAVMDTCFTGEEGKKLLAEDFKIAKGLGIGGSPTWLINNKYQASGIDAESIKRNICQYNSAFAGCAKTLSSDTKMGGGGGAAPSCN